MSLNAGARLGPYEVLSALGAGGMGEVYRARDGTLQRDVALKILPELFALDPDRLARFRREAQVLASLNHPNIAAIYGFEESTRVHALVLELVEGPTLADRIAQGAIPLEEALPIARQIAEALEAAHEHGIVHRDLKPANIKLRPDGTAKVLDFGLAKLTDSHVPTVANESLSPTMTSPAMMTGIGVLLGTAAYMSPEQAKGRAADKRSDIWAFGAVLYEMLAGQRAFGGDDVAETLAAVLRQNVDWGALPASTPSAVRQLIARCLNRDGKRRLRDIGEARIVLDDPASLGDDVALTSRLPGWRRAIPMMLTAITIGVIAVASAWYLKPSPPLAVTRFSFALPDGQAFEPLGRVGHLIAMSPDGTQMAYVAAPARLYVRSMSQLEVKAIPGTDGYEALTEPVFSPDGRSIAFFAFADRTLKRIAIAGGAAVTLCPADRPFGMSWGPDGIVFGQGSKGIMRVSPNGGTPEVLVRLKDGEEAHGPQLLPGGQDLLFTIATGTAVDRWDSGRIIVQSLASGKPTTLIVGASDARYLPTGHLVYALSGRVFAVGFDARRRQLTGEAVPIVEGVRRSIAGVTGAADFSVSSTGSLVYIPDAVSASSALLDIALIDRKGQSAPLKLPPGPYLTPRVSPDGARVAFSTDDGREAIVWIYDVSGTRGRRRLTFGGNNRLPVWSPDGTRVAFQSDRDGDGAVFWQRADNTGTAERLTKPEQGTSHVPEAWSPKGDTILFSVTKGSDMSLWTFSIPNRTATAFGEVHSSNPTGAVFSPDGRWVAYTSTQRGTTTLDVQPFPATGAKYQLFAKGGESPHMVTWSPDGTELFYDPRPGELEVVTVTTRPTFAFGNPASVPSPFQLGPASARRTYDITPDGGFVGLLPAGQKAFLTPIATQIHVVVNWFQELQARVPGTHN